MKDLLNREIQVGNYICYALTSGRSANLAVYQVKEVLDDKIKAKKIDQSYGGFSYNVTTLDEKEIPREHALYKHDHTTGKTGYVSRTQGQIAKIENKLSTLSMPERVFILDGFAPEVFCTGEQSS